MDDRLRREYDVGGRATQCLKLPHLRHSPSATDPSQLGGGRVKTFLPAIDAQKHPVLMGILYGICLAVALSLPVTWYWRIAVFFVMLLLVGFIQ